MSSVWSRNIFVFSLIFVECTVHLSTESCDLNYRIPLLGTGADGFIGFSASLLFLFLVPPVLYTLVRIVVPFG